MAASRRGPARRTRRCGPTATSRSSSATRPTSWPGSRPSRSIAWSPRRRTGASATTGGDEWIGGDPDHAHRGSLRADRAARHAEASVQRRRERGPVGRLRVRRDADRLRSGSRMTPRTSSTGSSPSSARSRRVLRKDGTLWLNLGDTYGGSSGTSRAEGAEAAADRSDPRSTGPRALNRAERGETPHAPRRPARRPRRRTSSASPGAWRSRCRQTAGTSAPTSSGRSRTRCRARRPTGRPSATNTSSC